MSTNKKRSLTDRGIYRRLVRGEGLTPVQVTVKETDLLILAESDVGDAARELVLTHRHRLERYIACHPLFVGSLFPLPDDDTAPSIVRLMLGAAKAAGVGPMAAVAGAIAEEVGKGLRRRTGELVIENGGDLYLAGREERVVAVFTGEKKLASRLGLKVTPGDGIGVCTSSGRFGHSLSFGEASTATVIASSAALADAAATALGNEVRGRGGIDRGLRFVRGVEGVRGALIVHGGKVGVWGEVELVSLGEGQEQQ